MNLETRKLTLEAITRNEFYQFAELERAGRRTFSSSEYLQGLLKRHDVFACFDGEEMAAYILIIPEFCYLGGSIFIEGIRMNWKFNNDAVMEYMIRSALSFYDSRKQDGYITMEVDRKHEPYLRLFRRLGFTESLIRGRMGKEYVVLISKRSQILNEES